MGSSDAVRDADSAAARGASNGEAFELPADHPMALVMTRPLSERTLAELKAIDAMTVLSPERGI